MFRAILPDGDMECARYELQDKGVEVYTDEDEMLAFIPYPNLIAIINEEVELEAERSIM